MRGGALQGVAMLGAVALTGVIVWQIFQKGKAVSDGVASAAGAVADTARAAVGAVAETVRAAGDAVAETARAAGDAVAETARAAVDAAGDAAQAVNPLNADNVVSQGAIAVVRQVTGDQHATVGNRLFELLNPDVVAREKELINGNGARSANQVNLLDALDRQDADNGRAMGRYATRYADQWTPAGVSIYELPNVVLP